MKKLISVVIALCIVLVGCTSKSSSNGNSNGLDDRPDSKYAGVALTPPYPRPNFTLTDTSGATYSFSDKTRGKPTFLFFGYTNCPDICPTTMADIWTALKGVDASIRASAQVVFVTTDVAHDTGPILEAWLSHFDDGLPNKIVGLTGTQLQIDAAQSTSHIQLAQEGGQQHSTRVLLYGSDDYARVSFLQSKDPVALIKHDLPLVA
jgi:protein SCO1/2